MNPAGNKNGININELGDNKIKKVSIKLMLINT